MSVRGGPSIPTNGLILCLDAANPKSATFGSPQWLDLSSSGASCQSNGAVSMINSGALSSWAFTGSSVMTALGTVSGNYTDLVIGMWIDPTQPTTVSMIFAKDNSADKSLRLNNQVSPSIFQTGAPNAPDNNDWQFNNVTGLSGMYINNQPILQNNLQMGQWVMVRACQVNPTITLPMQYWLSSNFSSRYFRGKLGFVLAYDHALTVPEVSQIWNSYRGRYGL